MIAARIGNSTLKRRRFLMAGRLGREKQSIHHPTLRRNKFGHFASSSASGLNNYTYASGNLTPAKITIFHGAVLRTWLFLVKLTKVHL